VGVEKAFVSWYSFRPSLTFTTNGAAMIKGPRIPAAIAFTYFPGIFTLPLLMIKSYQRLGFKAFVGFVEFDRSFANTYRALRNMLTIRTVMPIVDSTISISGPGVNSGVGVPVSGGWH
jgi:hypothetical protein